MPKRDWLILSGTLALAFLVYSFLQARAVRATLRQRACAERTKALDRGLRARFPLAYENIGQPLMSKHGRCLGLLEYHYRRCSAAERKLAPKACAGPDADIALYDVDAGRILLSCEKRGVATSCGQAVYDAAGKLERFDSVPAESFAARRSAFLAR